MGRPRGFTLIEVLIAMAITAFIAILAYQSLSTVIAGVDSTRTEATRLHEVSRAFNVISRDLRQFANRPVADEFGGRLPALEGGLLAREMLALTRAGWHNTVDAPRSALQRVAYYLDDRQLIRSVYPVLDRAGAIEPREAVLLDDVDDFQVRFLGDVAELRVNRGLEVDRRMWAENWVQDTATPGLLPVPPVAVEVLVAVGGWGEMERLYVLPPL